METVYFAVHDKELTEKDFTHMISVSYDPYHGIYTYKVEPDFYDEIKVAAITTLDGYGRVMVKIDGEQAGIVSTVEEAFEIMGVEKFHNPWLAAPFHGPVRILRCAEQWVGDTVHRIIDGLEYYRGILPKD